MGSARFVCLSREFCFTSKLINIQNMGKGDIKTKKGKITKGTFGVRRPRKHTPAYVAPEKPAAKKSTAKAAPKKKTTKKKSETEDTKKDD